jgi:hypothetical protein
VAEITPDPVAVYLAVVREDLRSGYSEAAADRIREQHLPALLAAVEAVLAQHQPGRIAVLGVLCSRHKDHRYFSITSVEAAGVTACPDCTATVYDSCTGCGLPVPMDSCPTRTAISRELLGKVPGAGHPAASVGRAQAAAG